MNLLDKVKNYISQHPQVVARLFARYGIQAAPEHRTVGNAIAVFREPFVNDLLDLAAPERSNYSNAVGDGGFQGLADGLARISLGASNLSRDVQGKPRLQSYRNPILPPPVYPGSLPYNEVDYYPTDRIFGINKTLFWALAAILVIALIMQYKGGK